jgi:ATP-dependent DNA helicase RecG
MKAADLDILLQEGEGVMLEYKEGISGSFARELVAFANTAGGRILLGVRDNGTLPKGMLPEDLGSKSIRRNPLIADLLHRIAFIEKAGTGIRRMRDGAREMGYPEPEFIAGNFFTALFRPILEASEQGTRHVPHMYPTCTPQVIAILNMAEGEAKTRDVLQEVAKIKNREHFYQHYLQPLLFAGLLERTVPDTPRSPKQRYVTTAAGRAMIEKSDKES